MLDSLIALYNSYITTHGLEALSADELLSTLGYSSIHAKWLEAYIKMWELTCEIDVH